MPSNIPDIRFLPTSERIRLSDGKVHRLVTMQRDKKRPHKRTVYIDGKQVSP